MKIEGNAKVLIGVGIGIAFIEVRAAQWIELVITIFIISNAIYLLIVRSGLR